MDLLANGSIYSLSIGEPHNGFKFVVGKVMNVKGDELEIIDILWDGGMFHMSEGEVNRYVIYVRKNGEEDFPWRSFENQRFDVTYKL
jgi:hypothetical protein